MKHEIEKALSPLLRLPLSDSWRFEVEGYQTLQRFEFGLQRQVTKANEQAITVGEYALHVGCSWRIIGQKRILAAYSDLYYPANNPTESPSSEEFDLYTPGMNMRDKRIQELMQIFTFAPAIVEKITADEVGSVYMQLNHEFRLEIMPMDSLSFEHWRLLQTYPEQEEEPHFVVTGQGIEIG